MQIAQEFQTQDNATQREPVKSCRLLDLNSELKSTSQHSSL